MGDFLCRSCRRHKDASLKAPSVHGKKPICRACVEKIQQQMDPSYRIQGRTLEARKKAKHADSAKRYRRGKLPGWMS